MILMFLVNLLVIRPGDGRRPVGRLHPRVERTGRPDLWIRSDTLFSREGARCEASGASFPRETRALTSAGSASSLAQSAATSLRSKLEPVGYGRQALLENCIASTS